LLLSFKILTLKEINLYEKFSRDYRARYDALLVPITQQYVGSRTQDFESQK
jgi:hypothetical protein